MNLTKATISASIVYIIPPFAFLLSTWIEMNSTSWNTNDSGAVQGFAYFVLASLVPMLVVAIAFPLLAIKLRNRFVASKWILLRI